MSNALFDKTTQALGTSLNMRLLRHNLISSNVANAETPGYHAKKMDFEEALTRALDVEGIRGNSGKEIPRLKADIYENPEGAVNNDGNTVDLEREMSSMAENTILYRSALQLINKKLAALRYAATDGR